MADVKTNCVACDDLKEYAPDFIQNGVTDDICTSLKNDTGFNASDDRDDCKDLTDANDCLIGNMVNEVDDYEVCDWQPFMTKFIGNLYNLLHAFICAICGIWTNIHNLWTQINNIWKKLNELEEKIDNIGSDKADCVYDSMKRLIGKLNQSTGGNAFVRYYRDNSGVGAGYTWSLKTGQSHNLEVYMDANVDNAGSKPADRDYVVVISYCCNPHNVKICRLQEVWYSSGDKRSIATIRKRQAQHPAVNLNAKIPHFSWAVTTSVLVKKGEHLKFNSYCTQVVGSGAYYRIHQVTLTWIPINLGSNPLNINEIMPC